MTSSDEHKPINLAVHESTDPEKLKLEHTDSQTSGTPDGSDAQVEAARRDIDLQREDRLAERQITIANRSAG